MLHNAQKRCALISYVSHQIIYEEAQMVSLDANQILSAQLN